MSDTSEFVKRHEERKRRAENCAEHVLKRVMQWIAQSDEADTIEHANEPEVRAQLAGAYTTAITRAGFPCGFKAAKALDDSHGWDGADAELVEILDSASVVR